METPEHVNGHQPQNSAHFAETPFLDTNEEDGAFNDLPLDSFSSTAEVDDEDEAIEQFLQDMEPEGEFASQSWESTDHLEDFFEDEFDADVEETAVISDATIPQNLEEEDGIEKQIPIADEIALLNYLARQSARTKEPTKAALIASTMTPVAIHTQPQYAKALWPAIQILSPVVWQVAHRWHRQNRRREMQRLPIALVHTIAHLANRVEEKQRLNRTIVVATFKRELSQQRPFS